MHLLSYQIYQMNDKEEIVIVGVSCINNLIKGD